MTEMTEELLSILTPETMLFTTVLQYMACIKPQTRKSQRPNHKGGGHVAKEAWSEDPGMFLMSKSIIFFSKFYLFLKFFAF